MVTHRKIGAESVLIPIASEAGNLNSFFQMNPTATVVWEAAVAGKSDEEIIGELCDTFDVSSEEAQQDVAELLETFVDLGALSPDEPSDL